MTYQQYAQKMLRFESPVKVKTKETIYEFLNKVIKADPRVFFYLKRFSTVRIGDEMTVDIQYEHQEFPKEKIYVMNNVTDETIFRNAVANYEPHIVLIVPTHSNLEWSFKKFHETCTAFYPSFTGMSRQVKSFEPIAYQSHEIELRYRIGRVMLKRMQKTVDQKIEELKSLLLSQNYPDSVKCLLAHNYLASTITYYNPEKDNPLKRNYVQSAYGALIEHQCVCQGYAEAFKRMMDTAGIRCKIISGKVVKKEKKDEWHAWNMVELKKYNCFTHIDCTWDSQNGRAYAKHFFKGDDFYLPDRIWNRYMYPSCAEGTQARQEAILYCQDHYNEMLKTGLQPQWINFYNR